MHDAHPVANSPPDEQRKWPQRGFTMPDETFNLLDEILKERPGWNKSHAVREAIRLLHQQVTTPQP